MELLARLRDAGLTVTRNGDQLMVAPRNRLTDELRAAIRCAKQKLLDALKGEPAANYGQVAPDLEARVRSMARRWGYSPEELAEALALANSDPRPWLAWTERDERDFGQCVTAEDFAAQYVRVRGLA